MFDAESHEIGLEEMVTRAFSRCSNFPKERIGVQGLADGLKLAAKRFGVPPSRIVAECAETSGYCPTDADMIGVARSLRPADPEPSPRFCPLGVCDGTGWVQCHHLHTKHSRPGGASWVEKEAITQTQFDSLAKQVDWQSQSVYESRRRCECHPPRPEDVEKKGKYA